MDIGNRMKSNYEDRMKHYLIRRIPVIVRVDGKAFHNFTGKFNRPYDNFFSDAMILTMKEASAATQNVKFAYTQSDEISFLLIDYDNLNTDALFNYRLEKIVSYFSSVTTMYFNKIFGNKVQELKESLLLFKDCDEINIKSDKNNEILEVLNNKIKELAISTDDNEYYEALKCFELYYEYDKVKGTAMFDARAFNIPESEVCNYFIWRQLDAVRNSVRMLGNHYYPHSKLQHVTNNQLQNMLISDFNVNWNDVPTHLKRGTSVYKIECSSDIIRTDKESAVNRQIWKIDKEIPTFDKNREFIERFLKREKGKDQ